MSTIKALPFLHQGQPTHFFSFEPIKSIGRNIRFLYVSAGRKQHNAYHSTYISIQDHRSNKLSQPKQCPTSCQFETDCNRLHAIYFWFLDLSTRYVKNTTFRTSLEFQVSLLCVYPFSREGGIIGVKFFQIKLKQVRKVSVELI